MKQPRILIVDDDPHIASMLARILSLDHHAPEIAANGLEAMQMMTAAPYDLILLDLAMHPVGGLEVLRFAKQQDPEVVVLIQTAHASLDSAVEALRLGAFDYLFKPSTVDTIRQRTRAGREHRAEAQRRRQLLHQIDKLREALVEIPPPAAAAAPPQPEHEPYVRTGGLTVDRFTRTASLDGKVLNLTTTEFDLLLSLVLASPSVLSARELVSSAMGYESGDLEARELVKWHIYQLRQKVEPDPSSPRYIKSVRHKGYLWCSA
jgi:DNA-binding response OmpR family regulator